MRLELSTCDRITSGRILKTGGKQGLILKPVAHKWCSIEAFQRDGLYMETNITRVAIKLFLCTILICVT